jgi:hypothetical protein
MIETFGLYIKDSSLGFWLKMKNLFTFTPA